jgi:hypothetical protein
MLKAKLTDLKADINTSTIDMENSSLFNLNSADLYVKNSTKTKKAK